LSPHDPGNDEQALALLTELFANWGAWVEHGVFDEHLQAQIVQFQHNHGVHPADGVVRQSTWTALTAVLHAEVDDLQHKLSAANHGHDAATPAAQPPHHQDPGQLTHYLQMCEYILAETLGTPPSAHPRLSAHGHNDAHWVSVVILCFRLFDDCNALNPTNPRPNWGSASIPDGEYGPSLQNAVRQFQELYHLHVTGEVDSITWQQLGNETSYVKTQLRTLLGAH
jgi:peptidoglycan hydrolase-like protein with peptidoglycan-binding domain